VLVLLHPVVLAIIDIERKARHEAANGNPKLRLVTNFGGTPWTP
jgi:hypothetical protein